MHMQSLLRKALVLAISAYFSFGVSDIKASRSSLKNNRHRISSSKASTLSKSNDPAPTEPEKTIQKKAPVVLSVINAKNHDLLQTTTLPILLNIKADWCTTYEAMATSFKSVANELHKKCMCAEIEVDSFEDSDETIQFLQSKYGVSINCIPTILVLKNGKVQEQIEGTHDKETFKTKILAHLK